MLRNIIDNRKHRYRWLLVTAIIEPTWHDNSRKDADQSARFPNEGIGYGELASASLAEAIQWANSFKFPVTLYLYDLGDGICTARESA